jgi:hypothetical protein
MGKSAPKAPDPAQVSSGQYRWNKKAAQEQMGLNALAQRGPFGSATFDRNGRGVPVGISTQFAPELQGAAQNTMGNLTSQTGLLPPGRFNPNINGQQVHDIIFRNFMSDVLPEWARQDENQRVMLAERGIPIGSKPWKDVVDQTAENRNAYMDRASNNAWLAGTEEEDRQRRNQLQDYLLPYQTASSNLGLLQGLRGLTPEAHIPQASIGAPDYGQNAWNSYNAEMANYNDKMSGLGQLVSTGIGLLGAPMTGGLSLGLMSSLAPTAGRMISGIPGGFHPGL